MFNSYGKYGIKLMNNGTDRMVEIDDIFPVDVGVRSKKYVYLFSKISSNWPSVTTTKTLMSSLWL
jgi:hypothetical protein